MSFDGFPKETLAFLDGIARNNEKAWFDAHRDLYEAGYIAPARSFVDALGLRLRSIAPAVQFSTRINGSLSRINRDVRFSKDKRPYKEHLGIWFWHGERRRWDVPGFWFELTPRQVQLGVGLYMMQGEQLDSFRQSVVHPRSGKALLAAIAETAARGDYEIGGKTRKLLPRGFATDPDRVGYLLHEGLHASISLPVSAASGPELVDLCLDHFSALWPINRWLLAEVESG
jgi:uncharacterized protein (TIGR02453 family)